MCEVLLPSFYFIFFLMTEGQFGPCSYTYQMVEEAVIQYNSTKNTRIIEKPIKVILYPDTNP